MHCTQLEYNLKKFPVGVKYMASFGELLEELRSDKKMTQKDLAKVLHVSVGTISNYERNIYYPEIEKLANLADFFQVTTDYLLGRCKYNFSPDIFREKIVGNVDVGNVIEMIRNLPAERQRALLLLLDDMNFRAEFDQYRKKENL